MLVSPRVNSNYNIRFENSKMEISIPFHKNYYLITTLLLSLIIVFYLFNSFLVILFSLPVIFGIVNMAFGKEIIVFDKVSVTQNIQIAKYRLKSKTFNINYIKNWRVGQGEYIDRMYKYDFEIRVYGPQIGRLIFDYGKDTIRLAGDIDEVEGKEIINHIIHYYNNISEFIEF